MRKLCVAMTLLCLAFVSCGGASSPGPLPTPTTTAQPTATPTMTSQQAVTPTIGSQPDIVGVWQFQSHRQTLALDVQQAGNSLVASSYDVGYDCTFGSPNVYQDVEQADISEDGVNVDARFYLYYFDQDGYLHNPTLMTFSGQLLSQSELELKTNSIGAIQDLKLYRQSERAIDVFNRAVAEYKHKKCG